MKSVLAKQEDGTIILTIPLSQEEIKKEREKAIDHAVEHTELPGFRKGKAPRNLVEEKVDPAHIQEDVLRSLLPKAYSEAVLEHNLKPIVSPKIHVTKLDEGKDWEFTATTTEMPEVKIGDYKKAVQEVTAKAKILIPGKEKQEVNVDDIVKALLEKVTITIPSILVESEVERLLSQLLDEVKSLGLSLDQYLQSTRKTVEQVKKEYEDRAKTDMTVEFALQKIAEEENITITPTEVEEAIAKATTPAEKENLEKNKYLLTAILRQQKTFDYLKNL